MEQPDSIPSFRRCRTCGRYFAEGSGLGQVFCSRPCSYVYVACSICGRYYRASARGTPPFCSAACSLRYRLAGRMAVALEEPTASPA